MIKRMLFGKLDRWQLSIVALGAFVGLLFLMLAVHYFGVILNLSAGSESLGENLVIAQKKVTKYTVFDNGQGVFTDSDLEALESHQAVLHVAPIVNNQFYVSLAMREEGLPFFSTDIFLQAINDDLLDVHLDNWSWNENAAFIPLVMPRDFMLMLNQFAASYKIPQVSEDIAKTLNFTIELRGKGGKMSYDARIAGFSNQMNAVLVPMSFMDFGNQNFADSNALQTTQLVLKMNQNKYGDFEQLIDDLNLEIKQNELLVVKIQGMLFAVLGVLFLIAVLIVLLSAMLIAQFSMLLVADSDYEIQTMLKLGYHPKQIAAYFHKFFIKLLLWVAFVVLVFFFLAKFAIDQMFINFGFIVTFSPSLWGLFLMLLSATCIVFWNRRKVLQAVKGK